ncbi:MAG: M20/M25/M40 family metallo-hydrolase [Theionarchaea archaeon]|nr:M20/M25/M40 family metallo-hydrolase [Theionarchaea archaeon]MBU7038995.1 M20/M25/M40 family metallo-hydrolase [Theionarchaea archaeon]
MRTEVVEILQDLIRIDTVNPPGNEGRGARYLGELFEKEGIEYQLVGEEGRENLVASLGEGKKRLLLLSHTDVVPASEEKWDLPPFSGEMDDGFIWGRGALDCKDLVAAEAYTLIRLKREKAPLNGTLIFAACADEEKGGTVGAKLLTETYTDMIRADFAINEGGGEYIDVGGEKLYLLQTGEKGPAWSRLRASGVAGHGSLPTLADNAVVKVAKAVKALSEYNPEIVIIPEIKELIETYLSLRGDPRNVTPQNVDEIIDSIPDQVFGETLRSVTRMTVSPNMIQGGTKVNIVPDECEAEVDVRTLPGQDESYLRRELEPLIKECSLEIVHSHPANFSSADSVYYRLIEETAKDVLGPVHCAPHMLAGATDSFYLRQVGIASYGVSLLSTHFPSELIKTVHGANERIDIESMEVKTEFLYRLARKYLS